MTNACGSKGKTHSMHGFCAKCAVLKPVLVFKMCAARCLQCRGCGYFWGSGSSMDGQPATWTQSPKEENMKEKITALAISLSQGVCTCYYRNGSFSIGTNMTTGESKHSFNAGTKMVCLRCRAREALEGDGVEYTKVDYVKPEVLA